MELSFGLKKYMRSVRDQCCGSGSVRIRIIFQDPDPFPRVSRIRIRKLL